MALLEFTTVYPSKACPEYVPYCKADYYNLAHQCLQMAYARVYIGGGGGGKLKILFLNLRCNGNQPYA